MPVGRRPGLVSPVAGICGIMQPPSGWSVPCQRRHGTSLGVRHMSEAREGKRGDSSGDQDVRVPASPPSPAPADESVVYEVTSEDLINEIKETADRLARGHARRGDLKILSRTLKELRYAFKVFAPYRHRRKITLFGSARLGGGAAGGP